MCLHLSVWEMRRWQNGQALMAYIGVKGVRLLSRKFYQFENKVRLQRGEIVEA